MLRKANDEYRVSCSFELTPQRGANNREVGSRGRY